MRRGTLGLFVLTVLVTSAPQRSRAGDVATIAATARAVAERCALDTATGWPERCPAAEPAALESALARADASTRIDALAALLGADTAALRMVAASSLARLAPPQLAGAQLSAPGLRAALDGLAKLAPYPRDAALAPLTRAALAAGRIDELLDGLAAVSDSRALARAAEHLLDAPDERGLVAVERLSRHGQPAVAVGALTALARFGDADAPLLVRATAIARPLLDSPDGAVASAAAAALLALGDAATVYERFATRARAGDLPTRALSGLDRACAEPSSERCTGALACLDATVGAATLGESVRAEALWGRYTLGPDPPSLAQAQRLASGPPGPLAETATRVVAALSGAHGLSGDAGEADGAGAAADPEAGGEADSADAPPDAPDAADSAEKPAPPPLNLSGSWSGSVSGSHRGSVRFTIRGLSVSGASTSIEGVVIPLSGGIRRGRLTLNGRKGDDYVQFRAKVSSRGLSGSWVGGVKRKVGDGSWSASR
jgi:hypothetical protein